MLTQLWSSDCAECSLLVHEDTSTSPRCVCEEGEERVHALSHPLVQGACRCGGRMVRRGCAGGDQKWVGRRRVWWSEEVEKKISSLEEACKRVSVG